MIKLFTNKMTERKWNCTLTTGASELYMFAYEKKGYAQKTDRN